MTASPMFRPRSSEKPCNQGASIDDKTALWFARKSYEHMANESALPDAVVAPAHVISPVVEDTAAGRHARCG